MMDLGLRIKEARIKRGLSQKALAEKIGKAPTTISCYENGVQIPPTEVLKSIALALYVPIDYFFGISCEKAYSDANLTPSQKEVVDLLFQEFTEPSNDGEELSPRQIEIIKRMVLIFISK